MDELWNVKVKEYKRFTTKFRVLFMWLYGSQTSAIPDNIKCFKALLAESLLKNRILVTLFYSWCS